jgi:ubiquinone/menaquinone biosynthesis C-methylase UbiE
MLILYRKIAAMSQEPYWIVALEHGGTTMNMGGRLDHVKTLKCSMFDMDFPDESFDIIRAEGSISRIGFKTGLKEWRRFLKPNGFLVVHDEVGNIIEKLEQISSCGYDLLGYFVLGEETWWNEYYAPLEKQIHKIRTKDAERNMLIIPGLLRCWTPNSGR